MNIPLIPAFFVFSFSLMPEDRETGYLETAPLPDLLRIFSRSMTYPEFDGNEEKMP